jgi:hypothetical protein
MIKQVWVFTNRNVIVFDENGEQVVDVQKVLGWSSLEYWLDTETEGALVKVIEAKPIIYISQWGNWSHQINLDELCCLLGKGKWYWEYKQGTVE